VRVLKERGFGSNQGAEKCSKNPCAVMNTCAEHVVTIEQPDFPFDDWESAIREVTLGLFHI
jgi:hypothetical protein